MTLFHKIKEYWQWLIFIVFGGGVAFAASISAPLDLFTTEYVKVFTVCNLQEAKSTSIENDLSTLKAKNVDNSLRTLTEEERATFKGCEIAKYDLAGRFTNGSIEVEIVEYIPVESGVEIYARAWKGGTQLGFGKDGSVDIERFVFINPPVLTRDDVGTIERTFSDGTNIFTRNFREDPAEAIKQKLWRAAERVGKTGTIIVAGKRGNTTTVLAATHDASFNREDTQAESVAYADFIIKDTENLRAESRIMGSVAANITDRFRTWVRSGFTFDTSSIGSNTVSTAKLTLYANGFAENTALGANSNVNITDFNPVSETAYVTADGTRSNFAHVDLGNDFLITNWVETDTVGNDITLNATGIANINGSGNTVLGVRQDWDIDLSFGGTWASNGSEDINGYFQDDVGADTDPDLTIEHAVAGKNFLMGVGF